MKKMLTGCLLVAVSAATLAAEAMIELPAPRREGGMSLLEAIARRRTNREIAPEPLTKQQLSDILFVANGITGADGKRTTPTARDCRDVVVFAALPDGLYRYHPEKHELELKVPEDIRGFCGIQKKCMPEHRWC